jgi:hypothetical protein
MRSEPGDSGILIESPPANSGNETAQAWTFSMIGVSAAPSFLSRTTHSITG